MEEARSRSTGVPTLRVRTRCDRTATLIERYARDVDGSGLFVRTREAFEVGAAVRFEYLLADGRCALAGEGRIAFRHAGSEVSAAAAGVGIAIDRLRQGDRAVVERMIAARGGAPSRFEQPQGAEAGASSPPLHPDALFADVKLDRADAPEAVAAYLSADLTTDLPSVRPTSSAPPPGLAQLPATELADQLEPAPERSSAFDTVDTDSELTPVFVPLEDGSWRRKAPSERPRRASGPHRLKVELAKAAVKRATELEREQRFTELVANAAREAPPAAPSRKLLAVLLVLVALALLGLAALWGALDPWLGR